MLKNHTTGNGGGRVCAFTQNSMLLFFVFLPPIKKKRNKPSALQPETTAPKTEHCISIKSRGTTLNFKNKVNKNRMCQTQYWPLHNTFTNHLLHPNAINSDICIRSIHMKPSQKSNKQSFGHLDFFFFFYSFLFWLKTFHHLIKSWRI